MDIILIDGRSGSGKSELALLMVHYFPDFQLLRLDSVYPGWDGLDAASRCVPAIVTTRLWREWDWANHRPGQLHELDAARPLLIEGVGAISRASRPYAETAIWVETDNAATRKKRALDRDGELYAPHWDRWAAQEEHFLARENPRSLADVIVTT